VFFANSGAESHEGAIQNSPAIGGLHRGAPTRSLHSKARFNGRTRGNHVVHQARSLRAAVRAKVPGFPKAKLNDIRLRESDHP